MTVITRRTGRRGDALSPDRIVRAAIELLDAAGEESLTIRALAERLGTGPGAIYWHVANKDDVLDRATEGVLSHEAADPRGTDGRAAIRAITMGVYDAIEAHPWAGAQLAREPWQPAMLQTLERLGAQLDGMGVPEAAQFDCATALVGFLLGTAAQHAAVVRLTARGTVPDRVAMLGAMAGRFDGPSSSAFGRRVAAQLPEHDDRAQFLAGVDLILTGIDAVR